MARKGAATATDGREPRRSSRIKDQVKPDTPPKKAPARPRTKKPKATGEDGDAADKEKPKSAARGKKRTSAEKEAESAQPAVNGGEDCPPPTKKAKPDSQVAAKPASKPATKPPSKAAAKPISKAAATETPAKPASKAAAAEPIAKPASKAAATEAGAKPASKVTAKPASRAGSRKPVSKADVEKKNDPVAPTQAPIIEEPEAEAAVAGAT